MSDNKTWLIKDHNFVTGPFSQKEVQEQLKQGKISFFAMVNRPGQIFWGFVGVYPEFSKFVDQTKLTKLTTTLSAFNVTKTKDTEFNATKTKNTEFNPPIQQTSPASSEVESVPYQVIEEAKTKEKLKDPLGLSFIMSVVVVLATLGVGYYFLSQQKPAPVEHKVMDEGQSWFLAGHYDRALKIWQEMLPSSDSHKTSLKLLHFQIQNDISMLTFLLQETKGEKRDLIQALAYIKSGDLTSGEQSLKKLIQESSSKEIKQSAFANMAMLSTKEGKCDFFKNYEEAMFGNKSFIQFLLSFCFLTSSSSKDKEKAKTMLTSLVQKQQSYYQEALLGLVYIQVEEGKLTSTRSSKEEGKGEHLKAVVDKEEGLKTDSLVNKGSAELKTGKGSAELSFITKLLDSDPYLTSSHYYPIWIDRNIYSWPEWLPLCKAIYETKEHNYLFVSLYAYCLAKAKLYEQALSMIKKAEVSAPESALVKALHVYIADLVHLKNESAQMLGYALKFNFNRKYVLPYILQARFCEQNQDWACADENWHLVVRHNPRSLSGLGGMAYAKYKQDYSQEAKEYMTQGLELSEGALYSPLLFLKHHFNKTQPSF